MVFKSECMGFDVCNGKKWSSQVRVYISVRGAFFEFLRAQCGNDCQTTWFLLALALIYSHRRTPRRDRQKYGSLGLW